MSTQGKNWENLIESKFDDPNIIWPKVSIIVPSENQSQQIPITLESIFIQKYPNFEVIAIDCSDDRSLEMIRAYQDPRIHIYAVACSNYFEMINKGITQATGEYVSFLFPGSFYISAETLLEMMALAISNDKPDFVYCGSIVKDYSADSDSYYKEFSIQTLRDGFHPSSLQAFWIRLDTLNRVGKFNSKYQVRAGLDLFCRLSQDTKIRYASLNRFYVDFDMRSYMRNKTIIHFKETISIIYKYFGFWAVVRWLLIQQDSKYFLRNWFRSLKAPFSK